MVCIITHLVTVKFNFKWDFRELYEKIWISWKMYPSEKQYGISDIVLGIDTAKKFGGYAP